MSENNHRKCAKCGLTRAEDMTVTYHRFPNPGITNMTKARAWSIYCWPSKDWTSVKALQSLHTTNKVLCGRHFNSTQFYDSNRQKLSKFAVPDSTEVKELLNDRENILDQNIKLADVAGQPRSSVPFYVSYDSSPCHGVVHHGFPDPKKEPKRFNTLENEQIYMNRRVCHSHFEEKYYCRNNRISNKMPETKMKFKHLERKPMQQNLSLQLPSTSTAPAKKCLATQCPAAQATVTQATVEQAPAAQAPATQATVEQAPAAQAHIEKPQLMDTAGQDNEGVCLVSTETKKETPERNLKFTKSKSPKIPQVSSHEDDESQVDDNDESQVNDNDESQLDDNDGTQVDDDDGTQVDDDDEYDDESQGDDDDETQIGDDVDKDYTGDDDMNMSSRGRSPVFEMVLVDDDDKSSASKPEIIDDRSQKAQDSQLCDETIDLKLCRACLSPRAPLLPLPPHSPLLSAPAALCRACASEMQAAARLVERARRAEEVMSQLAWMGMLTMENIQKIDREKNQLTHTSTFTVKHYPPVFYNFKYVYDENELTLQENDTKITDDINIQDNSSLREDWLESDTTEDLFDTVNDISIEEISKQDTQKINKHKLTDLQNKMDEYFHVTLFKTTEEKIAELQRRKCNAPLKCEMCYQGFKVNEIYGLHMHKHSEQCGEFTCAVCQYRWPSRERLVQHMYFRHSRKFSCRLCRFETTDRNLATFHWRRHEAARRGSILELDHRPDPAGGASCEECGVKFATDAALQVHMNISSRHKNFKKRNDAKERVRQTIARRNAVRAGKEEKQSTKFDEPVPCEKCGALTVSLSEYHHHFSRKHPHEERTWYPAVTHPHLCELCGKLLRSNKLKAHMSEHEDGATYQCDACGKQFARRKNMIVHSRTHMDKRYPCSVCGKLFKTKKTRYTHKRYVHSDSNASKCEFCGKCFKAEGHRKQHIHYVHLRNPYPKKARTEQTEVLPSNGRRTGRHVDLSSDGGF